MSLELKQEQTDLSTGTGSPTGFDEIITKPGENDVLCGRGGGTNNHCGNIKFRSMVNEHKLRYLAASKVDKPKVAREVVHIWRGLTPPGRFLARKDDSKKGPGSIKAEGNVWHDVGDKKAREKASQCLRERTPDVIPFVQELQRQQDFITGHGLKFVEQQMREQNTTDGGVADAHQALPGYTAAEAHGLQSSMHQQEVANAFSLEHFTSQGGFQPTPPRFTSSGSNPNTPGHVDPLSLNQMSQDEVNQWFVQNDLDPVPLPPDGQQLYHSRPPLTSGDMELPVNFDDAIDAIEDEMTLEEYQKSLEEYLRSNNLSPQTKKKTKAKTKAHYKGEPPEPRAPPLSSLEDMRQNSWVRSFHSIETKDSGEKGAPTLKPTKKRSTLEHTIQRTQMGALARQGQSTRTNLTTGTEMSTKSALSTMSGISLFSDMSEESRTTKMNMAQHFTSNLSMMSEMTDLSETLNSMDLNSHYAA